MAAKMEVWEKIANTRGGKVKTKNNNYNKTFQH